MKTKEEIKELKRNFVNRIFHPIDVLQENRCKENNLALLNQLLTDIDYHAQFEEELYLNMQYYMEYCQFKGYVTPQEWLEKHKHF